MSKTAEKGARFFRHVMQYRAFDRARLYGLLPHAGDEIQTELDEHERPLQDVFFYLRDLGFLGHANFSDFAEMVAVLSTALPVVRLPRPPAVPPQTATERWLNRIETTNNYEYEEEYTTI